ncbi:hypothetical protein F4821DRAFT_226905 [Hypoxylon rubiginosum]|uniref:Uncharacterized protein n=1 Tax=Hypoxylon rubiginosum TaxID=110542 RepID=A0ACC0DEW2_9PEZI|nr:hypothetical protein F4821DRAFT_226905 [Hypoxylon rubiginosum]
MEFGPILHIMPEEAQQEYVNNDNTSPFRFLDLPLELRQEVYAHLLVQDSPINCSRVWFTTAARHLRRLRKEGIADCCGRDFGCAHYDKRLRPRTGILRSCRRVSEEALDVLYAQNTFCVFLESGGAFRRLFNTVGEMNLRRVRRVKLHASTRYYSYHIAGPGERQWQFFLPPKENEGAWAALLEGLLSLEFVMLIPIWGHHKGWPVWVLQLEPILKFIGEHVDEQTDVTVDDNYSMFLCEAVDRCFTKPFRRVRTKEGDSYYNKTRFDPENITEPIASDEG